MTDPRRPARRFRAGALLLCVPFALALLGARSCQPGRETPYRLAAGSALIEGCIDGPCLCPASFAELAGGFTLTELATHEPGPARLFAVEGVAWSAGVGEHARRIEGGGFYENDRRDDTQRMSLSLRIDGGPFQIFDSGLVEGGQNFPKIAISTRLNGAGSCFDIIFDLRAVPADLACLDPDDPRVHYVAGSELDPGVCLLVFFACAPEQEVFSNACGCGCLDRS